MLRRKRNLIVVFMALAALQACASNPARSPEAQIAIVGRQVIAAADAVVTGVDGMIQAGTLPQAEGVLVLERLRTVGVTGQKLAEALKLIDEARDALSLSTGTQNAKDLLTLMQNQVLLTTLPIGNPETRQAVAQLLGTVSALIIEVALAVGGA